MELGVCYYPEQWPAATWAGDARRMAELGLRWVRVGEFAWSRLEPSPGRLEWAWLDRAVEALAEAGLKVVLCTPTAAPPKWLVDRSPEILAVDEHGQPRRFGSRRHYDFSSDLYLAEARRIAEAVAARYGAHPAVAAWQVDNEYGCHFTVLSYSPAAVRRFRLWLAARYGSIEALNRAWGTVFWSQEYRSFDEVDAPVGTVTEANPSHRLDYRRFASDEVVRFNRVQVEAVRARSPGRPVGHNVQQLFTGFDHHRLAHDLDFLGWDSYPLGALEVFWFSQEEKARWLRTGHPDFAAFHHDLYRPMSRRPLWIMEQQPGPVNWAPWNPAPRAGMVRLWTWEAFAHGADVVSYFWWRPSPSGQEQMHAGLYTPDDRLDAGGEEVGRVAGELARVHPAASQRADVALVFDYDAQWVFEAQPQAADYSYLQTAFEHYQALRSLGLDVDLVGPEAPLDGYRLVVLPGQAIVPDGLLDALRRSGAELVIGPRSGSKTGNVTIPDGLPPGPLRELVPVRVHRVESLRPGATEPLAWAKARGLVRRWREHVELLEGAWAEGTFDADGGAAVVRAGRARYLAGLLDPALLAAVLDRAAADAGLATTRLPAGLRLRRRGPLRFAFNYGDDPADVPAPRDARWLLGGARLEAAGVAAWQEI